MGLTNSSMASSAAPSLSGADATNAVDALWINVLIYLFTRAAISCETRLSSVRSTASLRERRSARNSLAALRGVSIYCVTMTVAMRLHF